MSLLTGASPRGNLSDADTDEVACVMRGGSALRAAADEVIK